MNKTWRIIAALFLLSVNLAIGALYQASTTAQALLLSLRVLPLNIGQVMVVNVLVIAGIALLFVLHRNAKERS